MNNDLISREEVLDEINRIGVRAFADYASYSSFFDFVSDLSTEANPQGEWQLHGMIYYCSECGHECGESGDNFCGNCGADMRKDAENEYSNLAKNKGL